MARNLTKRALLLVALAFTTASPGFSGPIKIVASTTDLASIASAVGGDLVEATSICRPNADPHRVELLPSYMVRVARADLYLKIGLGLDAWADLIVEGSHSSKVKVIDCSEGVPVLEKPAGRIDASMGDVHPDGNPHYWLDPANGGIAAHTIAEALGALDPSHASEYTSRAAAFAERAVQTAARGREIVASLPAHGLITYHRSWTYFASALGLDVLTTVEPIPGIPPTGKHLDEVVSIIKTQKPIAVLEEPYFSRDAGEFLNRTTGIRVLRVSAACDDATPESYLAHFDAIYAQLQAR